MTQRIARAALFLAVCAATCLVAVAPGHTATRLSCYVNLWIHGQTYSGNVTRSVRTSCPFAKRVASSSLTFIVNHGGQGDGDFYVRVYSPVTFRWYRMHCYANGSLYAYPWMHVTCTGGIGALVRYTARSR
jgi:hypothetical protein